MGPAVPALVGVLRDEKRSSYLWKPALDTLGAIGAPAVAAKPAILDALRAGDMALLAAVVQALTQIGARLNKNELSALVERYRNRCDVSLPGAPVNETCFAMSNALSRLAGAGGYAFKPVESRF